MDWKSLGGVKYRAAYAAKYYTADTNVAEHLTMLKKIRGKRNLEKGDEDVGLGGNQQRQCKHGGESTLVVD